MIRACYMEYKYRHDGEPELARMSTESFSHTASSSWGQASDSREMVAGCVVCMSGNTWIMLSPLSNIPEGDQLCGIRPDASLVVSPVGRFRMKVSCCCRYRTAEPDGCAGSRPGWVQEDRKKAAIRNRIIGLR